MLNECGGGGNLQSETECLTEAETADLLVSIKFGSQQLTKLGELRFNEIETAIFIASELLVLQGCAEKAGMAVIAHKLRVVLNGTIQNMT